MSRDVKRFRGWFGCRALGSTLDLPCRPHDPATPTARRTIRLSEPAAKRGPCLGHRRLRWAVAGPVSVCQAVEEGLGRRAAAVATEPERARRVPPVSLVNSS